MSMIHIIYGNDWQRRRRALTDLVKNNPVRHFSYPEDADVVWDELFGASLFQPDSSSIIVHDGLAWTQLLREIARGARFGVDVILNGEAISKEALAELAEQQDLVISEYPLAKTRDAGVFRITDALAKGDTRRTWLSYQELLAGGYTAQHIYGTIWWQVKNALLLIAQSDTKSIKPFVAKKTRGYIDIRGEQQIRQDARELIQAQHRAPGAELAYALEEWILSR